MVVEKTDRDDKGFVGEGLKTPAGSASVSKDPDPHDLKGLWWVFPVLFLFVPNFVFAYGVVYLFGDASINEQVLGGFFLVAIYLSIVWLIFKGVPLLWRLLR